MSESATWPPGGRDESDWNLNSARSYLQAPWATDPERITDARRMVERCRELRPPNKFGILARGMAEYRKRAAADPSVWRELLLPELGGEFLEFDHNRETVILIPFVGNFNNTF